MFGQIIPQIQSKPWITFLRCSFIVQTFIFYRQVCSTIAEVSLLHNLSQNTSFDFWLIWVI